LFRPSAPQRRSTMAARQKGSKDHRIVIQDVEHWKKEIMFSGVVVAEIHSSWFGPCEVMLPTIQSIMIDVDDAPSKIKFALVNVSKLEDSQRKQVVEEEKKQKEIDLVQRRKAGPLDGDTAEKEDLSSAGFQHSHSHHISSVASTNSHGDTSSVAAVPLLEKYSNYDHPRPLWVFIKDGKMVGELRSAHPSKLRKLINKILTGHEAEFDSSHEEEIKKVRTQVLEAKIAAKSQSKLVEPEERSRGRRSSHSSVPESKEDQSSQRQSSQRHFEKPFESEANSHAAEAEESASQEQGNDSADNDEQPSAIEALGSSDGGSADQPWSDEKHGDGFDDSVEEKGGAANSKDHDSKTGSASSASRSQSRLGRVGSPSRAAAAVVARVGSRMSDGAKIASFASSRRSTDNRK